MAAPFTFGKFVQYWLLLTLILVAISYVLYVIGKKQHYI